jgi:SUN family beta-glucosidase
MPAPLEADAPSNSTSQAKRDSTSSAAASASAAPEVHTDTGATTAALALWKSPSIPFPDGTYDCSTFPSDQQGVVSVDYLGFGGWSGIQYPDDSTAVSGMTCTEGAYCSYACQPGMSKTQWPSKQPSDGQSRGGLLCQNGKLHMTQPSAQYLCEWGAQSSYVVNQLSQPVAICRTDYPGTENMVVPTVVGGNETLPLTVVNEDSYYQWEGKLTSAQYYVNKMGGSASSDCLWGTASADYGNWAPVNFGAGYTGGTAWLSIMYNPLQTTSKLDYNVKIECVSGTMNGECVYENGVIQQGGTGCTVSCNGVCHFVLY